MTSVLESFAAERGVRYFLFNFTDLRGMQRSKLVPASAAGEMEVSGAGFAGFAAYLDMGAAQPDMFAIPDVASVMQLPWKPEVAWVPRRPRDERPSGRPGPPGDAEAPGREPRPASATG